MKLFKFYIDEKKLKELKDYSLEIDKSMGEIIRFLIMNGMKRKDELEKSIKKNE